MAMSSLLSLTSNTSIIVDDDIIIIILLVLEDILDLIVLDKRLAESSIFVERDIGILD
jgi:hypothetical protein